MKIYIELLKSTLREEIWGGIDFSRIVFSSILGINFRKLGFTEDLLGINLRKSSLYKDIARVNLTFALRNIISTTLVYGFENYLGKN